ncbi:MAG: DMT family transporter [Bacillota bacterium]|nr:DMT family transporter [Bacillota bacterium]
MPGPARPSSPRQPAPAPAAGAPTLALLVGVAAISSAAILTRASASDPLLVALWRLLLAALLLLPAALARHGSGALRLGRQALPTLASGLALAVHFAAWNRSLLLTSVASSVTLVTVHPVFILLWDAWRLRRPAPATAWWGSALAVVGSGLVGGADWGLSPRALQGDLLALLGALAMAAYLLLGRRVRGEAEALPYSVVVYLTASAALAAFLVVSGRPLLPLGAREWALMAGLAVGPTIFGHTLFSWALGFLPAQLVSVSILGEPVGAGLLAWLLLGERPSPGAVAGDLLILAGIALSLQRPGRAGAATRRAPRLATAPGPGGSGAAARSRPGSLPDQGQG